ncbi:MAG: thiamine pyrophosphate-dependent enzyme [Syntrophales bacterium]|jgi:pyruvate ferredoxin oxidoreductase beta subunit|nr:thiamine pyrophosphate-dependent enzyme [Syntrophales bacterium]MCK9527745.1 thiamine pyrophosphate-dependent enzyme [Syntrophales bacterium]MDX9921600.1 thiamine pyrophosphate-dependent enzyme [Syntrophales bacterium]
MIQENFFKINEREYILPGNRACQGCGLSLAYRYILKALRENTVVAIPPSCLCVLHGLYPLTSVTVPAVNSAFAANASCAAGLVAALRAMNRPDVNVLALSGDGGTYDIGIQSLSGAAERNTDFIFACYDNEAYMNTGTQRSGATPMGALTTTTPILTKRDHKKDFIKIMEAHNIPYIATVSPSFPIDLYDKFVKAGRIKGTRYIQIDTPCPPGWGYPSKDTVRVGRMAVETGIFPLLEIEEGKLRFTGRSKTLAEKGKRTPIIQYVERQGRFRKMSIEQLNQIQAWVDKRWNEFVRRAEM